MNKADLAERLNGRAYGQEITREEAKLAAAHGLVVVFGASDDGMEFRGAIDDEVGCYNGGDAYLTRDGLLTNECDAGDGCPYYERIIEKAARVTAEWCIPDQPTWTYRTTIPHATFDIQSDDEDEGVYCRGIVFALADIPA